jgi:hypothetical protein
MLLSWQHWCKYLGMSKFFNQQHVVNSLNLFVKILNLMTLPYGKMVFHISLFFPGISPRLAG